MLSPWKRTSSYFFFVRDNRAPVLEPKSSVENCGVMQSNAPANELHE